jgi:hypothetical protein
MTGKAILVLFERSGGFCLRPGRDVARGKDGNKNEEKDKQV